MTNGKERPAKRGLCGEAQSGGLAKPPQLHPGSTLTRPALTLQEEHWAHSSQTHTHTYRYVNRPAYERGRIYGEKPKKR